MRLLIAAALLACSLPSHAEPFESEPLLHAATLVEPSLLTGPGWRVQPRADVAGLQARFWIDTDWGAFPVDSVELLAERIGEMPALQALHTEGITDALTDTGIGALMKPVRAVASIAMDPVGSAARAPAGVLRYLGDRWRKIEDRAKRLGDRVDRALFHDGDVDDATLDRPNGNGNAPWWDKPLDETSRLLRSQAGHSKARREIAAEFDIDPFTGNPLLRARLDQLAWAVAGGRMAIDRVVSLASAGTAEALSMIDRAAQISAHAPPEDLRRSAAERLQRWTADDDLIWRLSFRSAFPPPRLHALLDRLDALQPAAGAQAVLDAARLADSELEARFVANALDMLLHLDEHPAQGGRLIAVGALVGYLAADGELVLPLAVDLLSWTEPVAHWFEHAEVSQHPRRTVLVSGAISERAARELSRRGWSLRAHYRWPGAPPYRRPGTAA